MKPRLRLFRDFNGACCWTVWLWVKHYADPSRSEWYCVGAGITPQAAWMNAKRYGYLT